MAEMFPEESFYSQNNWISEEKVKEDKLLFKAEELSSSAAPVPISYDDLVRKFMCNICGITVAKRFRERHRRTHKYDSIRVRQKKSMEAGMIVDKGREVNQDIVITSTFSYSKLTKMEGGTDWNHQVMGISEDEAISDWQIVGDEAEKNTEWRFVEEKPSTETPTNISYYDLVRASMCSICGMVLNSKKKKTHWRTHFVVDTTAHSRIYVCQICDSSYICSKDASNHLEAHSGNEFVCFCGEIFQEKSAMDMHMLRSTCGQGLSLREETPEGMNLTQEQVMKMTEEENQNLRIKNEVVEVVWSEHDSSECDPLEIKPSDWPVPDNGAQFEHQYFEEISTVK